MLRVPARMMGNESVQAVGRGGRVGDATWFNQSVTSKPMKPGNVNRESRGLKVPYEGSCQRVSGSLRKVIPS